MSIFVLGLDLGQVQDFSANVIIEAHGTPSTVDYEGTILGYPAPKREHMELAPLTRVEVRYIERYDLGTRYLDIAARVRQVLKKMPVPSYLVVDQTGVGRAGIEMLSGCNPIGITITAGEGVSVGIAPREWRVPKRDLVAVFQVLAQNKQFGIAKGLPNRELLAAEMQNFRMKITPAGHNTYEAIREGAHDDLVLAVAIACWVADQTFRRFTEKIVDALNGGNGTGWENISPI